MGQGRDFISALNDSMFPNVERRIKQHMTSVLKSIDDRFVVSSEEVRSILGCQVDEMALCFADEQSLHTFISSAVQHGWRLFNYAEDEVQTSPIPSSYNVQYWFLQHDMHSYRLELMHIEEGHSPYHYATTLGADGFPWLAHASFKIDNELGYANAVRVLRDGGYDVVQHCTSNYGRFSYFSNNDNLKSAVIKPRLNTRDDVDTKMNGTGSSGN